MENSSAWCCRDGERKTSKNLCMQMFKIFPSVHVLFSIEKKLDVFTQANRMMNENE